MSGKFQRNISGNLSHNINNLTLYSSDGQHIIRSTDKDIIWGGKFGLIWLLVIGGKLYLKFYEIKPYTVVKITQQIQVIFIIGLKIIPFFICLLKAMNQIKKLRYKTYDLWTNYKYLKESTSTHDFNISSTY